MDPVPLSAPRGLGESDVWKTPTFWPEAAAAKRSPLWPPCGAQQAGDATAAGGEYEAALPSHSMVTSLSGRIAHGAFGGDEAGGYGGALGAQGCSSADHCAAYALGRGAYADVAIGSQSVGGINGHGNSRTGTAASSSPRQHRGTPIRRPLHPQHQHPTDGEPPPQEQPTNDEYFNVVIRVRPPLQRELSSPAWQNIVSVSKESEVCLHEVLVHQENGSDRGGVASSQVVTNHTFTFDRVYDRESSQPDVYTSTARASILSTLKGYNATILAYGPTGTGKTYTMEGPRGFTGDGRGIIPRSMEDIFQHIRLCCSPQARFLVRASYLQIYNEVISDLLKPDRSHLVIREDRRRGVFVEGLSEWLCRSPAEVHTLMDRGGVARATAQTAVNDASSRSHAVFIVIVEQSETLRDGSDGVPSAGAAAADGLVAQGQPQAQQRLRVGRLNLVDLAGSERPRLTGASGQRLEETKKINQSLSALGNVIGALTERRPRQHIPYRDSKLTRLLEDSLGGNCRTTMIAMVSPAAEVFAESLSTLKFAHRAKAIRNTPQVNEDVDQETLLRRYESELKRLRAELRQRSRNVVDKRELLQLEEERRRAEEDRAAAVSALEERSLHLEQEKASKRALEERIQQMSSQLLVGGQQDPIGSEYAAKLSELERERSTIEEDKAQVARYKQLLLKQRDIMIALTQRLHERDETIIGLQDEMDARDRRHAELEDQLDQRSAQLLAAERRAVMSEHGVAGSGKGGGVVAGSAERQSPPEQLQYPPENAVFDPHCDRPMQLLSADEKVAELTALLDRQRQENHRLTLELEELSPKSSSAPTHSERALLLNMSDRIVDALKEVTGPTIARLRIVQEVMALKRLVASGGSGASGGDDLDVGCQVGGLSGAESRSYEVSVGKSYGRLANAAAGGPSPSSSGETSTTAAVTASIDSAISRRPASPARPTESVPRREGSGTPISERSFSGSTPRAQGIRGRRSTGDRGGYRSSEGRPRSVPSWSSRGGYAASSVSQANGSGLKADRPLTVRRSSVGGAGSARSSSLGSMTNATVAHLGGAASSLKSSAVAAAVAAEASSAVASPSTLQERRLLSGVSTKEPPRSRSPAAAATIAHTAAQGQKETNSALGASTIGAANNAHASLDGLLGSFFNGGSSGSNSRAALFGNFNVGTKPGHDLPRPMHGSAFNGAGQSTAALPNRSGPVRATPLYGVASLGAANGNGIADSADKAGPTSQTPQPWRSLVSWPPQPHQDPEPTAVSTSAPAPTYTMAGGLPPATAAAMASQAFAARGSSAGSTNVANRYASKLGDGVVGGVSGTGDGGVATGGPGSGGNAARPDPFTSALAESAIGGHSSAFGAGSIGDGASHTAESLREEAQKSVDELLARRKAELQRAATGSGATAGLAPR